MTPVTSAPVPVAKLPFGRRHVYYLAVSSMEQLIGSAVAAVVGVMVPMIVLVGLPHLSSFMQGISAAVSLVGIAVGSMVIGRLSDRQGYLFYFRLCPALIMAGAVIELFAADSLALFLTGMFLAGLGVGGGYSLDSDYISELMPQSRRFICVGIAKSTSAIGFIFGAVGCYFIIKLTGDADAWIYLMLIVGVLGLVTFLMRLRWWESPAWLMAHGMPDKAIAAARHFFGDGVTVLPVEKKTVANASWSSLFSRENMPRVILSGIPWACEGVGVYGIGVFLPMLVSALGLMPADAHGLHRIELSVEITAWINFFILPGFILGLCYLRRMWHITMLTSGFYVCALGLLVLLLAHLLGWPMWVSIVGFFIFEIFLNAGPHLVTYVIPSQIYPVAIRGAGVGIASMLGKVGAIIGVIIMPVMLHLGGIVLVLAVSIAVMILGAVVSTVYGPRALPNPHRSVAR